MNKKDVIKMMAKDSKYSEKVVTDVINEFIDKVNALVYKGVDVSLINFVNFKTTIKQPHKSRHPQTGEVIDVPKRYILRTSSPRSIKEKIASKPVY